MAAAGTLAACQPDASTDSAGEATQEKEAVAAAPTAPSAPAPGGEQGEAGVATAYAGLDAEARAALRIAHLKGFVLIADKVSDAGQKDEAGVLVSQGLLEVAAIAESDFARMDLAPVRAAETGEAAKIKAALAAFEGAQTAPNAAHIVRMMAISTGLYGHVLHEGMVDPIEYQHALGAMLAAQDSLKRARPTLGAKNAARYNEAVREMEKLVALWPGVTAPEKPASLAQVLGQAARVELALSGL